MAVIRTLSNGANVYAGMQSIFLSLLMDFETKLSAFPNVWHQRKSGGISNVFENLWKWALGA